MVHCDLNNLDAVKGVFQRALDVMGGRIDVLVNCAGIQRRSPSVDFLETDWDDVRTRYAPHLSFYFTYYNHALTLDPFILSTIYFPGLGRQSKVSLAPFPSRWPSYGS